MFTERPPVPNFRDPIVRQKERIERRKRDIESGRHGNTLGDRRMEMAARRAKVAELMSDQWSSREQNRMVNDWLESQGYDRVSPQVLNKERRSIQKEWNESYGQDSETFKVMHIQRLNRLYREVCQDLEAVRAEGGNTAPLLAIKMQAEMNLAKIDGSLVAKHEISGEFSVEHMMREVLAVKPQAPLEVLELLPDEEFKVRPIPRLSADG